MLKVTITVKEEGARLGRYWDKKLSQNVNNNPFPLAPRDLVRLGLVDCDNYATEGKALREFRNSMMEGELAQLSQDPRFVRVYCPEIKVLGIGLARDLGWVVKATQLGFRVEAVDVSEFACTRLYSMFEEVGVSCKNLRIIRGEIEAKLREDEMGFLGTLVYHGSQFIQVQKRAKMRRIMKRLAILLAKKTEGPSRRLYLVHPFDEDNQGERKWNGRILPGVEWKDTTPYSKAELLDAMGEASKSMRMDLLGVHSYYHQVYSFLKLSVSV